MNRFPAIFATLLLAAALAACGKEESPPSPLKLSAPERPFAAHGRSGRDLSAEAEVTASKGPVQVTLRLYKTKIRPEPEEDTGWKNGEFLSLWVQAEIKNVGTKKLAVSDMRFYAPGPFPDREDGLRGRMGISLEVTDAAGNRMSPPGLLSADHLSICRPNPFGVESKPGDEGYEETTSFIDKLRKQGLTFNEINVKLFDFEPKTKREKPEFQAAWLDPGVSTRTAGWVGYDACAVNLFHMPRPKPIGEFSHATYYFPKPGKYYIRAVYDTLLVRSVEEFTRLVGHPPPEDAIRFKTPSIEFEALP